MLFIILLFPLILSAGELPIGARAGGMSDAVIADVSDALCIYHNPAGLLFLRTISADLFLGWEGFPLVENWAMLYAKPISNDPNFGLGIIHQRFDFPSREYSSYQMIIPTTYSLSKTSSMGMNFKYLTQRLEGEDFKAKFSLDFGLQQRLRWLSWGFIYRNGIDPRMASFPSKMLLGASLTLRMVKLEVDFEDDLKESPNKSFSDGYRVGAEIFTSQYLALRSGWSRADDGEDFSLGLGIFAPLQRIRFDYCYRAPFEDAGLGTHWISYSYLAP
jgi:hypothetical protein